MSSSSAFPNAAEASARSIAADETDPEKKLYAKELRDVITRLMADGWKRGELNSTVPFVPDMLTPAAAASITKDLTTAGYSAKILQVNADQSYFYISYSPVARTVYSFEDYEKH